ncbi:MAG: dihydrofolate reductase [Deltaproteobacteria bacterium]|nr:dihydrofolate reductase [Deltaproteobacteria bacterium]
MGKVRVNAFGMSLDGFGAGPDQDLQNPMGVGGMALHQWVLGTKYFQAMHGDPNAVGREGIDNDFAVRGFDNVGAWILGRNMFGPVRGGWGDHSWKGWWGDNPPYHVPVYVLTHHPREPLVMAGGTTFYFVTDGIRSALEQAQAAAGGQDVRIGGGANTVRQYLQAGLIDELHLAVTPAILGRGEPLLAGIDLAALGYRSTGHMGSELAMHVVLSR